MSAFVRILLITSMASYSMVAIPNHEMTHHVSTEHIQQLITEARNRFHVPAIAVSVMNSDQVYVQTIQGVRVHNQAAAATLDDYFHLGSTSKSVLAVLAAKLVEEHKLNWQTRFFDVIPELRAIALDSYHAITLEDLLLCEAGIRAFTNAEVDVFPQFDETVLDQRLEFAKLLVTQTPASSKKGDKFTHLYSNASYTLAALMLERISGKSYETQVKEILRDQLGINVVMGWPNRNGSNQPWGHSIQKDQVDAFGPDHPYHLPAVIRPAGDLSMTPKAYARYTQLHLLGLTGHDNYLTSASYDHLHHARSGFSYGILNGSFGDLTFSGFDGSAGTFYCRSLFVPGRDFALTVMMNASSPNGTIAAVDWISRKIVEDEFEMGWWQRLWLWLWW